MDAHLADAGVFHFDSRITCDLNTKLYLQDTFDFTLDVTQIPRCK